MLEKTIHITRDDFEDFFVERKNVNPLFTNCSGFEMFIFSATGSFGRNVDQVKNIVVKHFEETVKKDFEKNNNNCSNVKFMIIIDHIDLELTVKKILEKFVQHSLALENNGKLMLPKTIIV